VPDNAPYSAKAVLDVHSITVNGVADAAIGDDGIQVVAYIGDSTGNAAYSSLDGQNILRTVVGLDSGFDAFPLVDPALIGDTTANGRLSSLDANRMFQYAQGLNPADIPPLPDLAQPIVPGGLDPTITVASTEAAVGDEVWLPVVVDTIPAGLNGVELWLQYDEDALEFVGVDRGSIPQDFDFLFVDDATAGRLRVDTSNLTLVDAPEGGTLLELGFRLRDEAAGVLDIDLQLALLNDGRYTLTPEPIAGPDGSDGRIAVIERDEGLSDALSEASAMPAAQQIAVPETGLSSSGNDEAGTSSTPVTRSVMGALDGSQASDSEAESTQSVSDSWMNLLG
jgi:hypothetical protein